MLELDRDNKFVKAVFDYINGDTVNDSVRIFRQLEEKHQILVVIADDSYKEGFFDDNWVENNLYPFLNDSQLIIAGDVIDNLEICNTDFQTFDVTWRHWGEILAKWLNKQEIEKPKIGRNKSTKWKYIDFYMNSYTSQWIRSYKIWAKAILEIISQKDKVFGSEYKSIND